MAYTLHNDIQEDFKCKLELEGASLNSSHARIIIEAGEHNLLFKGKIDKNGNCSVPISNLKKIFLHEILGNMKLEVIADDTFFVPWEDSVTIKPSKSVKVESVSDFKNKLIDESTQPKKVTKPLPNLNKLSKSLIDQGFTRKVIEENKKEAIPILGKVIHEYYKSYGMTPKPGTAGRLLKKL